MGAQQSGAAGAGGQASGTAASSAASSGVSYTSTQANGTGTQTQARKPAATKIILNVYEPAKGQSMTMGFGIYHTGIEFSGVEYSFAGGPDAGSGTGVMSQQPRATPDGNQWKFKESIELGSVHVDYKEFDRVLQELKDAFPANTYDLIHRNCNHFTTAVSKRLGVHSKYPSWINRAASWGSVFTSPPKHLQPIPAPKPKESVFKSTVGHRMDGGATIVPKGVKVAAPVAAAAAGKSEHKKADTPEAKKSGASSSGRKNPWADPNFVPPQMRKDPVVATGRIDA